MKKNHKRISAAVLSLALGFSIAGAPAFAPFASAQTTITAGEASTVDLTAKVSLTINKYDSLPVTNPLALPGLPRTDATFDIKRIPLTNELDTLAGWQELAAFDSTDPASLALPTTFTMTTVGGTITETNTSQPLLTVGAYLVVEQPKAGFTEAAPFVVTLPFTDSTTGDWSYDQVVHPKNQANINIDKDVVDLGATLGSTSAYTISAPLPAGDLTTLVISDDLPAQLGPATGVTIYTRTGGVDTAFTTSDTDIETTVGDGNVLSVAFGADDRDTLQGLRLTNADLEIVIKFNSQIVALPAVGGSIINHAEIDLGGGLEYSTSDPDNPNPGAETRLGALTINKRDASGNLIASAPTEGAEFQLWRCDTSNGGSLEVRGNALSAGTSSQTTLSTGTSGTVTIQGVQVIDFFNGAQPGANASDKLCVVETKAPAGFVLNPEPQEIQFNTVTTTDPYDMVVSVTNLAEDDVVNLPETGGNGTMAMIAAGVLVAAAGGAAAVRGNRARNK
ncbi:type 1 fimbrial major subunit [Corynebacterium deserti GIMN1.010]|uniref:Type 1 fimbrial major subunit n=1 Tax=Corynebacterium deserti GIMN1.010 TaxID=931089 RepID=A0A0M4CRX3_9CORY|nr:SpaH/EbpB family LPXTG-anchored major pilin [Corynebacterium deserti]ALC06955.1 type 1 fimbrial major subunit [Corynebacterium deserti GIMN1.010]